jgi:hypothetical protein
MELLESKSRKPVQQQQGGGALEQPRPETSSAHLDGEVRWHHVARSRAIRRILERGIAQWMEGHKLLPGARGEGAPSPRYRAFLQREGDGHYVHCQIEVVAGGESWMGSRVGRGIQQALADCLAHMTRKQPLLLSEPQPVVA